MFLFIPIIFGISSHGWTVQRLAQVVRFILLNFTTKNGLTLKNLRSVRVVGINR